MKTAYLDLTFQLVKKAPTPSTPVKEQYTLPGLHIPLHLPASQLNGQEERNLETPAKPDSRAIGLTPPSIGYLSPDTVRGYGHVPRLESPKQRNRNFRSFPIRCTSEICAACWKKELDF
ncbi:hypothetical protein AGOR_G00088160 [Albula goreensis]|uniref:Uncharacterized protein n=1 Tax=Albula goreensis TaxID=1534307 RepID=A0A8T3DLM5_9TELE|nr:hypothetical protein AGOR_G00088160 [Albula goreensis]